MAEKLSNKPRCGNVSVSSSILGEQTIPLLEHHPGSASGGDDAASRPRTPGTPNTSRDTRSATPVLDSAGNAGSGSLNINAHGTTPVKNIVSGGDQSTCSGGGRTPMVGGSDAANGGNTDLNRPIGVPFPFKTASLGKLGASIRTTNNEAVLRFGMIN